jgi:hypothetical protein
MRLRAVLVLGLLFAGFLSFAQGMLILSIVAAAVGLGAFLVLPGGLQKAVVLLHLPEQPETQTFIQEE